MARNWFEAQAAQYKHAVAQGDGLAVWDGGVKCYLPSATLYGACSQNGTPAPDAPAPIAHGGGTVAVKGRNLLPSITEIMTNLTAHGSGYSQYILHVSPNTKVTICSPNVVREGLEFYLYALPYNGVYGGTWLYHPSASEYQNDCVTVTSDENGEIKLVGYGWNKAMNKGILTDNLWAVMGEEVLPYEPYVDGGSVTAPALYAIPDTDYRDEWNAVTGQGVRWCHALTLDGTEEWGAAFPDTADSHTFYLAIPHPAAAARCSHFPVGRLDADPAAAVLDISFAAGYLFINHPSVAANDVEAFKTWLAQQSVAGTPVTVVYAALNSGLTDVVAEPFTHLPDARLMQPDGCAQLMQTGGGAVSPLSATYVTHC